MEDQEASSDINDNDADPTPRDNGDNKHGTRCAGEVAATAFNNHCGVGVAYNVSIGGVRMLDGTVNDAVEARALGLNPDHIDIYSASWGPEDDGKTVDGPGPLARRAFIHGVTTGRKGRGSIFVWASGNGGRHTDSCNCDGYTNSIFTLSISSATQGGFKPWYLEECSSTLATTYSSGTPGQDRSVATVDMDGKMRPAHLCTLEHTGTSASAPLAAGIAALALEANPGLTWRDVQYLVVLTSRSAPLAGEPGIHVPCDMFSRLLHPLNGTCSWSYVLRQIDPTPGSTLTVHMDVTGCDGSLNQTPDRPVQRDTRPCRQVRFLEHVQCKLTLRFFPRGNLRVQLTSAMGTTSTLLFERPKDVISSSFDDWPFLSVHFWGEKAEGRWTLQISNSGTRSVNQPGNMLHLLELVLHLKSCNLIHPLEFMLQLEPGSMLHLLLLTLHLEPSSMLHLEPDNMLYSEPGKMLHLLEFMLHSEPGNMLHLLELVLHLDPIRIKSNNGAGKSPEAKPQRKNKAGIRFNVTRPEAMTNFAGPNETFDDAMQRDDHDHPVGDNQRTKVYQGRTIMYDCDTECDHQGCYGQGPTQCVACGHYKLDSLCVSRCPPRSFPNQDGICWPCHDSCDTCAGAGQDSCLTCAPAHLRVTDLAVCLQQCPEGYYEDSEENLCVPCEPNCASCHDQPDYCSSCEHHLVLYENRCYATCPVYTYETEDYRCSPCHTTCATCNGSSETQCISCRTEHMSLDGACLESCPSGYYAHRRRRECIRCPQRCATCGEGGCLTCERYWTLDRKANCVPEGSSHCDSGEYWEGGHCRPCHSICEKCDGPTETNCISCSPPLLLEGSRCLATCLEGSFLDQGVCVPCLHTCQRCVSRVNCTLCSPGLHLQSGECRTTCAHGYYSDGGVCAKCYLSCMTCTGPRRDQCVTCPPGWQLAAGECHPDCPLGFFKSQYGCQKCDHYCHTCSGEGPLNCTSCPARSMLDGGMCTQCLGSQYYDSTTRLCQTCHDTCKSCTGRGPFQCSTCRPPLHLDLLSHRCLQCCSQQRSQDCCQCDQVTGNCPDSSPSGKRRIHSGPEQGTQRRVEGEVNLTPYSPLRAVTPLAVGLCATVFVVLALTFTLLQARSRPRRKLWMSEEGYKKVSTDSSTDSFPLNQDENGFIGEEDAGEDILFTRT
uniref:P/Homo B domain-containing protein n=1 Tax=Timema shepardi TaxID=629360 RepID=A0A7R9B362_TIMSH|nr:unnamed protein product [Timema shepardi]